MNLFSEIRLVTLDLDDTLWPCHAVIHQAEAELFAHLQQHASRLTKAHDMDSMREHRNELMHREPDIAHDLTAVRLISLRRLLERYGYDPGKAQPAMELFREARNRVTPFPDVRPALKKLMLKYCVVSVTNGNAEVQYTPLKDHFHFSFTAAEVGAAKPDPQLFHRALQCSGVAPHQSLHIGDDPQRDVLAARSAGMRTVWMNRTAALWPQDLPPADATVEDFYELFRVLQLG
ncbi:MAG: HAD family hydrolase [Gammaproteobacteria bacterium]|nr:HAD family hydrolase [Gammaproteobacteria bacterium]